MSTEFIDLNRTFHDLKDPDQLYESDYSYYGFAHGRGWKELLKERATVVLGAPGIGKTVEFQEQTKKINDQGQFAFYVDLAVLASNDFPLGEMRGMGNGVKSTVDP